MDTMEAALLDALERLKRILIRVEALEDENRVLNEALEAADSESEKVNPGTPPGVAGLIEALTSFADCHQPGYFNDTWSETAKVAIRRAAWEAVRDSARIVDSDCTLPTFACACGGR